MPSQIENYNSANERNLLENRNGKRVYNHNSSDIKKVLIPIRKISKSKQPWATPEIAKLPRKMIMFQKSYKKTQPTEKLSVEKKLTNHSSSSDDTTSKIISELHNQNMSSDDDLDLNDRQPSELDPQRQNH